MYGDIHNPSGYDQPSFQVEEREELIKCDCHHNCDSYSPSLMLDGYDGDKFYAGHKEQYLSNFEGTLLQGDLDELTKKINKQIKL